MIDSAIRARVLRAGEICRLHGITQAQIADALQASQSQISRILAARGVRPSRLLDEVCLYAERHEAGVTAEAVRANDELVEAVKCAWDGSAAHARALSTVIRSLSVLKSPMEPVK
jgi:transcriptional regulator with XRE-family HTH domain